MKATIDELTAQFQSLNIETKIMIVGGIGIPLTDADLQKMFNYNSIGGFNSDLAKFFNKELNLLALTDIGSSSLQELLAKTSENSLNQIAITNTDPLSRNNPYYNWDSSQGSSLDIKNLIGLDLNNDTDLATGFQAITHELFHAYESIVKNLKGNYVGSNEVKHEIDANLFAGFAEKELDHVLGVDNFYFLGVNIAVDKSDTPEHIAFKQSWDDIMLNKNFSVDGYNKLIDSFKNSQFNNNGVGKYNSMDTNHIDATGTVNIYNLFNSQYKDFDFSQNSTGDSGNGGGSSWSSGSTGGTDSGYSPNVYNGGYDPNYGYSNNNGGNYWFTSPATGMPQNSGWESGNNGGIGSNYIPWWYYLSNDSSSW